MALKVTLFPDMGLAISSKRYGTLTNRKINGGRWQTSSLRKTQKILVLTFRRRLPWQMVLPMASTSASYLPYPKNSRKELCRLKSWR